MSCNVSSAVCQMRAGITATVLVICFVVQAGATTIDINAIDRGWYKFSGSHDSSNINYLVGDHAGSEYRNFFVFDLTCVNQPIVSAELALDNHTNGFESGDDTEMYTLFDVSTDITNLIEGNGGVAAFNDLGAGIVYGSHEATTTDNGTTVVIPLSAEAIDALNSASGYFAIGGAITTLNGIDDNENLFGWSHDPPNNARLILKTVPEPGICIMAITGLAICFRLRKAGRR